MSDQESCRIRVLDDATVIRIAAGEVVERPASVVKELCENAIDAGAQRIAVAITSQGGRITAIRVTDDGCGMNPEDARLAFARYATSKITAIDDLFTCETLGFRGEALASIASVARVTLVTKARSGTGIAGRRIVNLGGDIVDDAEAGCPFGTTITVEDLFYNTPTRKKFQKSLSAEIAFISGLIERLVLSRPQISFVLSHNTRQIISVPGGDLGDAIIHLYGLPVARQLIRVTGSGTRVRLDGYISPPSLTRKNPYQVYISVNSRIIASRALAGAIKEGYATLLPADRYPLAFLNLEIIASDVDVNVHPAKREVRLSREFEVRAEITTIVRHSLASACLIGSEPERIPADLPHETRELFPYRIVAPREGGVHEPSRNDRFATERQLRITETESLIPPGSRLPDLEIIGQLGNLYIIARTGEDDLILIDQHAAHERVLYEQVRERSLRDRATQELIEPVVISLSPRECETLAAAIPLLAQEGFTLDAFGPRNYLVRTVPVLLGRNIEPGEVRELIAELIAPGSGKGVDAREHIRRIVACRGAIKAGASCSPDQCLRLIRQLARTENPSACPHGRPTMVILKKRRLDELFGRI